MWLLGGPHDDDDDDPFGLTVDEAWLILAVGILTGAIAWSLSFLLGYFHA